MNLFELIYFIVFIWLAAWLANVIASALEMPLIIASAIPAIGLILIMQIFAAIRKATKKTIAETGD